MEEDSGWKMRTACLRKSWRNRGPWRKVVEISREERVGRGGRGRERRRWKEEGERVHRRMGQTGAHKKIC